MRVCIASKFPPIEGGIAARTYWQVRRLLDEGVEVCVVTNSGSVEREYRIAGCEEHLRGLCSSSGLRIVDLHDDVPWHIPVSPGYLERILNRLLEVCESWKPDRIESGYLVPYGIAGYLASQLTGIPHVVRHGGSDLGKFLNHDEYRELLLRVLREAECVISDSENAAALGNLGARVEVQPVYEPDPRAFAPALKQAQTGRSTYACIGKVNHHWRRKGLDKIVEWHAAQGADGPRLRIVGQGVGLADFASWAAEQSLDIPNIEPFVSPWEMPKLLGSVDGVYCLSEDDPVSNWSMLAAEARGMGVEVASALEKRVTEYSDS